MPLRPVQSIEGVAPEAERQLLALINGLTNEVNRLSKASQVTGLRSGGVLAQEGQVLRVKGGTSVTLPRARPENQGAEISVLLETAGQLAVTADQSTVNGGVRFTTSTLGKYSWTSNGAGGWLGTTVGISETAAATSTVSVPTWAQTLARGRQSGGSSPIVDPLQFLGFGDPSAQPSTGDIRSAGDLEIQAAANQHVKAGPALIAGDPGTEESGITVGGSTFQSVLKASDIGGSLAAQFIVHRHSTSLEPVMVLSRSNSDTSAHALVTSGQGLGTIYAAGHDGVDYAFGGYLAWLVDGTPGSNDMPTRMVFATTADGSGAPTERFRINSAGAWGIGGATFGTAGQYFRTAGGAAPPTWATISIGELGTIAADTFLGNFTGAPAAPAAVAGSTVAGSGLTYTTGGILAVGAGTKITVNANDVAWTGLDARNDASTLLGSTVREIQAQHTSSIISTPAVVGSSLALAYERAALSGAVSAAQNVNATQFAGIRDNGTLETARGFLNFGSNASGSISLTLTQDAGNDEIDILPTYIGSTSEITLNAPTGNQGTRDISSLSCGGTYRVTNAASSFSIEGFTAKASGFWFHFFWDETLTTDTCTLFYEDATATAANRIITPRRTDLVSPSPISGILIYNGTDARWHWIGDDPHQIGINSLNYARFTAGAAFEVATSAANISMVAGGTGAINTHAAGNVELRADGTQVGVLATKLQVDGASGGTAGGSVHIQEGASSHVSVDAGDMSVWVENLAPTRLMMTDDVNADWPVGYACVQANTTNPSITNSTSNLSLVSTFSIPANTLRAGSIYRIFVQYTLLETALAKNLTCEISYDNFVTIHGTVTFAGAGAAGTRYGRLYGLLRVLTTGAGGTAMATITGQNNHASTEDGRLPSTVATATTAINTTAARVLGMRMRMSATAAGNTITAIQGWIERLN